MKILRPYHYDSAHRLPNVPDGHKCGRLHGHTYSLTVIVEGPVDDDSGWVMDFVDVDPPVEALIKLLDHHYLNDVEGLENPTVERQIEWLWEQLITDLPLVQLRLREGLNNEAIYEGPS
jgi:6-pyruvoyltetrahydropterin/6-carboxytetrahydropterin synthase